MQSKTDSTSIVRVEAEIITADRLRADQNPVRVYLASLSQNKARPTMEYALKRAAKILVPDTERPIEDLPWHELRYQHVEALRTALKDGGAAPATTNLVLTAVRQVLLRCRRLGLMSGDDYTQAVDVASVKATRLPRGRALSPSETDALRAACDMSTPIGVRDRAALEILLMLGPRRAELVSLRLESFNSDRTKVRIHGKRDKERDVHLNDNARAALERWLELRGVEPGLVFCRISSGGKLLLDRALSPQFAYVLSVRLAEASGIASFSPHDCRRTFITNLLDANVDIATVSELAGHEQIQTTKRYDRRGDDRKRDAVALLGSNYSALDETRAKAEEFSRYGSKLDDAMLDSLQSLDWESEAAVETLARLFVGSQSQLRLDDLEEDAVYGDMLRAMLAHRHAQLDAFRVDSPPDRLSKPPHQFVGRGGREHSWLKWVAALWLTRSEYCVASSEITIEAQCGTSYGLADLYVPKKNIVVECGDTSYRKTIAAFRRNTTFVLVPYVACAPRIVRFSLNASCPVGSDARGILADYVQYRDRSASLRDRLGELVAAPWDKT